MSEEVFQLVRAGGFALALAIAATLQRQRPHARFRGSWRTNAALWALNGAVLAVACGACACTVARWSTSTGLGLVSRAEAPGWASIPATILALDLVSYAWHRANHRVPVLWRFHRVHHSDPAFTVSTALRFHPGELLLSLPLRLAAVAVLAPPVEAVAAFEVLFTLANLIEHGDIDLPAQLERRLALLLVTPALHRRHHARHRPDLDSNFGTIFSLWDRLARTYRPSASSLRIPIGLPDLERAPSLPAALALPFSRPRA